MSARGETHAARSHSRHLPAPVRRRAGSVAAAGQSIRARRAECRSARGRMPPGPGSHPNANTPCRVPSCLRRSSAICRTEWPGSRRSRLSWPEHCARTSEDPERRGAGSSCPRWRPRAVAPGGAERMRPNLGHWPRLPGAAFSANPPRRFRATLSSSTPRGGARPPARSCTFPRPVVRFRKPGGKLAGPRRLSRARRPC